MTAIGRPVYFIRQAYQLQKINVPRTFRHVSWPVYLFRLE